MQYPNSIIPLFLLSFLLAGCSTSQPGIFAKKTAHEKYADGLSQAGLQQTQLGSAWINAAAKSLQQPHMITLPYRETGYFAAENPAANAYSFTAKKGEKISVTISTNPVSGYLFFSDLWLWDNAASKTGMVASTDAQQRALQYIVEKDGQYILRIQPELLRTVEYSIAITSAGSLAFPVQRSGDPKMISFWGAGRDGGTRSHEGIDIAAKFRTPALAAADGYITRVTENTLGGKVVFLNPDNSGYSLYYAHLDSQAVHAGQRVHAGDIIGLVGKTGNAQHTVPHLHFGIYTNNGAIDPLVFIDNRKSEAAPVKADTSLLNTWARLQAGASIYTQPSGKSALLKRAGQADPVYVSAATDTWYRITTAGGEEGFVNGSQVNSKMLPPLKIIAEKKLLSAPDDNAPARSLLAKGTVVDAIGAYNDFTLVQYNNMLGWVKKN